MITSINLSRPTQDNRSDVENIVSDEYQAFSVTMRLVQNQPSLTNVIAGMVIEAVRLAGGNPRNIDLLILPGLEVAASPV